MAEFMSTTRGGRYLILDGYRYTVNRKLAQKTFWRCTEKHICTATVVTNTETDEIENKSKAQHHHAAHDVQINMGKKLLQLRDAMKEQLNQPLKRLYNEAFSTAGSSEAADDQASGSATRTFASLKSSLYRERRKLIQPQLKEEPEEFVLDTAGSEASSEKQFLSANDGSASTSDNVLAYDYEQASKSKVLLAANDFISFINKSPSPFHAVDEVKKKLVAHGFQELLEKDSWKIQPLNKYFVTKNQSTIIAFAVGGRYRAGNGFSIVGAHTDSPCLKVKPVSGKVRNGYCQVGVECYGGGIWNTWFDRDLTVAGRVIVMEGASLTHHLVNLSRPILRIPHLAIHLQREMNDNFGPNKETHLCPILNTCAQAKLQEQAATGDSEETSTASKHPPMLVKMLCDELGVAAEQLIDFELCLADTQPAAIGGALEEFIFSPRLDNLLNAYCACQGLLESLSDGSLEQDPNIRMISLFDNEEVGSNSAQGAGSTFQELVLRRVSASGDKLTAFEEAIAKSYMISADQAHAIHPNYAEKHEANHQPAFHKGVVVKFNANQRYATTAITTAILRQVAAQVGVPLQDFVVRNDAPCGSTIGPIMSAKLGMQTIDVGAPQLSMHSIREMGDTTSIVHCTDLFRGFFHLYPSVMDSVKF